MTGFMGSRTTCPESDRPRMSPPHDRGRVQGAPLARLTSTRDLLRVCPRPPALAGEDGLAEAEERDGDQVADEEERSQGRRRLAGDEEDGEEEQAEHVLLRMDGGRDPTTFLAGSPTEASVELSRACMLAWMNSHRCGGCSVASHDSAAVNPVMTQPGAGRARPRRTGE